MTTSEYPGNPSLAPEVKERVLTTFRQTLTLFDDGQLDEVVAGCDLILEMDDRFEPAKKLRQKAKDPGAPIDISELYELRDAGVSSGADNDSQLLQAVEELNNGNYEAAIDICNRVLAADPSNEDVQRIGEQANERLEAAPFIKQFLQEADDAIDSGDKDTARTLIGKARSLDPLHPDIAAMTSRLDTAEQPPSSAAPTGGGFDFGSDSSPFASAFGAEDSGPAPEQDAGGGFDSGFGFVEESEPEAESTELPEEEPAPADVATPGDEEPAATDFAAFAPQATEAPEAEVPAEGEAANFGFTLEEEPKSSPAEEPAEQPIATEPDVGDARTFDFSTSDVEVSDADQQKIANYLSEGDALFESGEYQGAIDSWSKIFLIDVTNEQASERIEHAKEKKREEDQKLDDLLTTGITAYDRGDLATARETFEEVIAQDPQNFRASEYLEKLSDHSAATGDAPGATASPSIAPEPMLDEGDEIYAGDTYEDTYEEEPTKPPPPPQGAPAPRTATPKPAATKSKLPLIAAVAVILLAVGGWFGWSMIGGGAEESESGASITQGKITRAEMIAGNGDYAQAIAILSSIEPGDPMREQALQLIAQYKRRQAQTGGTVGGRPLNQVRDELLVRAREAFGAEDYVTAKSAFEEAAKLKALDPSDREIYETATRQVSKLDAATTLFAQGSYADAIEELTRVLEEDPENVNARAMFINAHYNLGVNALKNRNVDKAIEQFDFVLQQDPNDTLARKSLEIAQRYQGATKDLMYEIYVKYLPLR